MFELEKTVTIGINIDKILDMINDDIFVVTADDVTRLFFGVYAWSEEKLIDTVIELRMKILEEND